LQNTPGKTYDYVFLLHLITSNSKLIELHPGQGLSVLVFLAEASTVHLETMWLKWVKIVTLEKKKNSTFIWTSVVEEIFVFPEVLEVVAYDNKNFLVPNSTDNSPCTWNKPKCRYRQIPCHL